MNLHEAIKLKGRGVVVPDCSRDELPQFFADLGFDVGAEIGVYKAAYTEKFCKAGLRMFAIDPWKAFGSQGRTQNRQDRQDFLYGHAQRVLKYFTDVGQCTIIRKSSMEAFKDFPPNSLDFVYIDGDHELPGVIWDIYNWRKVVKKGGIIAGHDYWDTAPHARNTICHAKSAVDIFTQLFQIEPWWLFGRSKPLEEEAKDDRYLSWMWFNK